MTYKQQLIDLLKSDEQVRKIYENQEDLFCSFIIANGINHLAKIDKPLQERFIRMYCKNKGLPYEFTRSGLDIGKVSFKILIDNSKDFDNQSEEVYKQIFLALTNLTKMKNKEELEKIIDDEIERLLDLDVKNMFTLKIFIFETIIPEVIKKIILNNMVDERGKGDDIDFIITKDAIKQKAKDLFGIEL